MSLDEVFPYRMTIDITYPSAECAVMVAHEISGRCGLASDLISLQFPDGQVKYNPADAQRFIDKKMSIDKYIERNQVNG